jgi:hypothetical protein
MDVSRANLNIIKLSVHHNTNAVFAEKISKLICESEIDEQVIQLANIHGISSLIFNKLKDIEAFRLQYPLILQKLQQVYFRVLSRNMVLNHAFSQIGMAFQQGGIEIIPLKGIFLAEYLYREPGLRQFSDLDILVKPDDASKCVQILESLHFRKASAHISDFVLETHKDVVHLTPMLKEGVSVEIHLKLHAASENYNMSIPDVWNLSEKSSLHGVEIRTMHLDDLLIHQCLHLDKHFSGGHMQLKSFYDIVNILEIHQQDIDWNRFTSRCKLHQSEVTVFRYILLTAWYFEVQLPEEIWKKYGKYLTKHSKERLEKFIRGETFQNYFARTHLRNLFHAEEMSVKFRYLYEVVLPPRSFMISKYNIKHARFFWLWYPYRWWMGIKGLISFKKR